MTRMPGNSSNKGNGNYGENHSSDNLESKRVHLIGICGVGMSSVARLLIDKGCTISGSDEDFYPPISNVLQELGIKCLAPHTPDNIPADANLIVIGRHAKLKPQINTEVRAALQSGVAVKSYPEVLNELTKPTENLIVAGSFGKTTISALLAWVLHHAGKDPSYFIGGVPRNAIPSSRIGTGKTFVLEGDEYPSSNWDTTSKFLYYNPRYVLLTSCEHDHLNVFPTYESYLSPFVKLAEALPSNGLLLASADSSNIATVLTQTRAKTSTYSARSTTQSDWKAKNLRYQKKISFDLLKRNDKVCRISSSLFGLHNLQNVLGASAILLELGLVDPAQLQDAIAAFEGVSRRLDLAAKDALIPIYQDLASSRVKTKATLKALRDRYKQQRIVVVFEPYSLSFRHKKAVGWYKDVFDDGDVVLVVIPRKVGEYSMENQLLDQIIQSIQASGKKIVVPVDSYAEALQYLDSNLGTNDVVVVLSSGGIQQVIVDITRIIMERFPVSTHLRRQ